MQRNELDRYFNDLLTPANFKDYCPNGVQVEGSENIKKIAFAVSATLDSITQAADMGADTLVVHHGLFWHFHGARPLTGHFAKRIPPWYNTISIYLLIISPSTHTRKWVMPQF